MKGELERTQLSALLVHFETLDDLLRICVDMLNNRYTLFLSFSLSLFFSISLFFFLILTHKQTLERSSLFRSLSPSLLPFYFFLFLFLFPPPSSTSNIFPARGYGGIINHLIDDLPLETFYGPYFGLHFNKVNNHY